MKMALDAHASASAIVRIYTSMMRDFGDCVQARTTTPATSSGSSISDSAHSFFRAAFADSKLGLNSAWANCTYLDSALTKFTVERLGEVGLRELRHECTASPPNP
jgi:hypothetical protein